MGPVDYAKTVLDKNIGSSGFHYCFSKDRIVSFFTIVKTQIFQQRYAAEPGFSSHALGLLANTVQTKAYWTI